MKRRDPSPEMITSVGALYALGMNPSDICDRMNISDSSVNKSLGWLKDYWSAPTWRAAALLEWQAVTGEVVNRAAA